MTPPTLPQPTCRPFVAQQYATAQWWKIIAVEYSKDNKNIQNHECKNVCLNLELIDAVAQGEKKASKCFITWISECLITWIIICHKLQYFGHINFIMIIWTQKIRCTENKNCNNTNFGAETYITYLALTQLSAHSLTCICMALLWKVLCAEENMCWEKYTRRFTRLCFQQEKFCNNW